MNTIREFFHFMGAWKIWHSLFHDFIWIDWVLFSICLIAFIAGALKGFGLFFNKLIRVLILIFTVMLAHPPLAEWASGHLTFAKAGFWNPFFFFVITGLMIMLLRKLSKIQSQKGSPQFHPFWDGVTGALSGFFFVLLLSSFLTQAILLLPGKKVHALFEKEGARYGIIMRDFVPQLIDGALTPVRFVINRKVSHA